MTPRLNLILDEILSIDGNRPAYEALIRRLSSTEQVERFAVLERDFEAERGEVTPTLKVRREVVARNFAGALEGLYANRAGDF